MKLLGRALVLGGVLLMLAASSAMADDWLPHPANAKWQYQWTDTTYNPSGTIENVVVQQQKGTNFTLAWADPADRPPTGATFFCGSNADVGWIAFQDSNQGLVNTDWSSCPSSSGTPSLCPTATSGCPDSLSSALYDVIWGARSPVLFEPLLKGSAWSSAGGVQKEVTSSSKYEGVVLVKVPAFPHGVEAAKVESQVALGDGSPGDDYGSGIRDVWWVRGVGPVKVAFYHADGSNSITSVSLLQTNLKPEPLLPDQNYFPFTPGLTGRYEWTNSAHMRHPEIEKVTVGSVSNGTAVILASSVSGLMRAAGRYEFTLGLDGLRSPLGSNAAASLLRFPSLGHGRHFFTPIDLMTFGFNPVLTAYPNAGQRWRSGSVFDFRIYGVTGRTWVVGIRTVHVPAGTFRALEVRSRLTQRGHPFGSGVRTMWFAPGRGLVKLVFQHRDGSTSVVQLLK